MDLKLILDIVVVLLLIPTIVFAVILNNRLGVLRKNRDELARLIAHFNEATVRAESGIPRLRKAAEDAGKGLQDRVERANALRDDLAFLCERADETALKLEQTLRGARNEMKAMPSVAVTQAASPPSPPSGPAPAAQAVGTSRPAAPPPPPPAMAPVEREAAAAAPVAAPPRPQPVPTLAVAPGDRPGLPAKRAPGRPLAPPASNLRGGTDDLTAALRGLAEAATRSEENDDEALFSPEPERSEAERELLRALRSVR